MTIIIIPVNDAPIINSIAPDSATEEELIRKVMVARGVNPDDINEIEQFWSDYHGISEEN